MARLLSLDVADGPEVWSGLGFALDDGDRCWVSEAAVRLGAAGEGIMGWDVSDAPGLDDLPRSAGAAHGVAPKGGMAEHPNGVIALDHVVARTPDLDRTIQAFESAGVSLRRIREIGPPERPNAQAFFKLGDIAIEVVGPTVDVRPGPARFWGLAFTVADLDATAAYMGSLLEPAKEAVQSGRRIATLDRAAGSTVAMAFLSKAPRRR